MKPRTYRGPSTDATSAPATLVVNPSDDFEFTGWATRLAREYTAAPEGLQALLRFRYREAVVRRRELSGESLEVWYVYRDGHWTPSARRAAESGR